MWKCKDAIPCHYEPGIPPTALFCGGKPVQTCLTVPMGDFILMFGIEQFAGEH